MQRRNSTTKQALDSVASAEQQFMKAICFAHAAVRDTKIMIYGFYRFFWNIRTEDWLIQSGTVKENEEIPL